MTTTFRDRLDILSKKYGSLRKLAIHCKIPYNTLYDYHEKGEAFKVDVVLRLSEHTGQSVDWLLMGTDNLACTASDLCKQACKICQNLDEARQRDMLTIATAWEKERDGTFTESPRGKRAKRVGAGN